MTIEWKDSYLIGDAEIDAEHQFAFALANEFIAASDKAALTHCAMQLYQHFQHEEALMRVLKFPEYAAHVKWHNQFVFRLNDISASIDQDSLERQDLDTLMTDWAMKHIVQYDARLAAYLEKS
jgi:hemerythrin